MKRLQILPIKRVGVLLLLLLVSLVFLHDFCDEKQKHQVAQAIKAQWDKPDRPVEVLVVVVEDDFAIADWLQEARGGRAVLRNMNGSWQTLACGDAQIKHVQKLTQFGMRLPQAQAIVQQLQLEERNISQEKLRRIDQFSGVVDMRHHAFHH